MPMYQRSAESFRAYQLVFTVSRYCIDLLRAAGLTQVYPEAVYGTADVAREQRAGGAALALRRRTGGNSAMSCSGASKRSSAREARAAPFAKAPGLTLGLVSLISPIKQFPALFADARADPRAAARRCIWRSSATAAMRRCATCGAPLAPLGRRARFWGYQANVGAIYPQLDYLMTGLPEKEALGLNALEAQACGTPVLAPDAPPFTETVARRRERLSLPRPAPGWRPAFRAKSSMRSLPDGRGRIRASPRGNTCCSSRMPRWLRARAE